MPCETCSEQAGILAVHQLLQFADRFATGQILGVLAIHECNSRFVFASTAALLSAAVMLVHRGIGDSLRDLLRAAALHFALLDVLRLALLFIRVCGLVSPWHDRRVLVPIATADRVPRSVPS